MSRLLLRPLPAWTDPITRPRKDHTFKASWASTVLLLRREVDHLALRYADPEVIVQVQASDVTRVRVDGSLRSDAKIVDDGVVVSFESMHGPLRYVCDRFTVGWARQAPGWQANVRAIALGLEALRKVDRYGIAARGEQYRGWAALGAGIPPDGSMSRRMAAAVLSRYMLRCDEFPADWPYREDVVALLFKRGAKMLHPDAGGDSVEFRRLQRAREVLTS